MQVTSKVGFCCVTYFRERPKMPLKHLPFQYRSDHINRGWFKLLTTELSIEGWTKLLTTELSIEGWFKLLTTELAIEGWTERNEGMNGVVRALFDDSLTDESTWMWRQKILDHGLNILCYESSHLLSDPYDRNESELFFWNSAISKPPKPLFRAWFLHNLVMNIS